MYVKHFTSVKGENEGTKNGLPIFWRADENNLPLIC